MRNPFSNLFGRRRLERVSGQFEIAVEVKALFQAMQRVSPGAAFLFARTLYNARDIIDDERFTEEEKIKSLDKEIADLSGASALVVEMAMRFVKQLLKYGPGDVESWGYRLVFSDISKHGERYREPDERDELPPTNEYIKGMLQKLGVTCVADILRRYADEAAELIKQGKPESVIRGEINEFRWVHLAMLDVIAESDETNDQLSMIISRMDKLLDH